MPRRQICNCSETDIFEEAVTTQRHVSLGVVWHPDFNLSHRATLKSRLCQVLQLRVLVAALGKHACLD